MSLNSLNVNIFNILKNNSLGIYYMSSQEMFTNVKNSLRAVDNMPWILDKTNPHYNQSAIDRFYIDLKRLKSETVDTLARQDLSESKRENYKTLLKDLDDHTAMFEAIVSNGLAGGKRRNKRSYKKSRRYRKKTRRYRKKTRHYRNN
jgi:hypothetical protein